MEIESEAVTVEKSDDKNPEVLGRRQNIVIFGTGTAGQDAFSQLQGQCNIIGFLDNDPAKIGGFLYNRRIYAPKDLDKLPYDTVVVASMYYAEMRAQLVQELKVPLEKITIARRRKMAGLHDRAFPVYLALRLAQSYFGNERRISDLITSGIGKRFDLAELRKLRTSDTLFVLGSGASINQLTTDQWNDIRNADSIGFNFWLLHDFVPTFYGFENPATRDLADALYYNLRKRTEDYLNNVIMSWSLREFRKDEIPDPVRSNVILPWVVMVPGDERRTFVKSLRYFRTVGLLRRDRPRGPMFWRAGSISLWVHFAFLLGYTRIVLCGVDLNGTPYFYESEQERCERKGLRVPRHRQVGHTHSTNDRSVAGEVTIDFVLQMFQEFFLEPHGVTLYIGSRESALHPMLPYFWGEA